MPNEAKKYDAINACLLVPESERDQIVQFVGGQNTRLTALQRHGSF